MPRKHRNRSTPARRARILQAASQGNLTAAQVEERYGVNKATYYRWVMNAKRSTPRSWRPAPKKNGHIVELPRYTFRQLGKSVVFAQSPKGKFTLAQVGSTLIFTGR
jgi:transposase-like protein